MLKLVFFVATVVAQKRTFYGKILETQGDKLACQIYYDMALYDFRSLRLINQTYPLGDH
jgi:hypothetical protein